LALSAEVLLPVALFFALGVPIVVLLWRIFVVGGELRRQAQFGRTAQDIARRADVSLCELAEVVDSLRRRKADPEVSAASLHASSEALSRYAFEAEAVDRRALAAAGTGLKPEIERAQRAVELIEHGRTLLAGTDEGGIPEGETSVKRGYLNLLHAREAIRERAQVIADAAKASATEQRGRLNR
jgi:hypothetical protein